MEYLLSKSTSVQTNQTIIYTTVKRDFVLVQILHASRFMGRLDLSSAS